MPDTDQLVRTHVARFHPNFSTKDFERNGEMVRPDVAVWSNGTEVQGRDGFVERIKRFETPFPGMQLTDRLIIVDGQSVAVLFAMQGAHHGPYGDQGATGHLVEVMAAEIFDFDEHGMLAELFTLTRLGDLTAQLRGHHTVEDHQEVQLHPVRPVSEQDRAAQERTLRAVYADPGTTDSGTDALASARVLTDAVAHEDVSGWHQQWSEWRSAIEDSGVTIDRLLMEGHRAAVRFTVAGRHGDRSVLFHGVDFVEFDTPDQIVEVIRIHNTEDIAAQLGG